MSFDERRWEAMNARELREELAMIATGNVALSERLVQAELDLARERRERRQFVSKLWGDIAFLVNHINSLRDEIERLSGAEYARGLGSSGSEGSGGGPSLDRAPTVPGRGSAGAAPTVPSWSSPPPARASSLFPRADDDDDDEPRQVSALARAPTILPPPTAPGSSSSSPFSTSFPGSPPARIVSGVAPSISMSPSAPPPFPAPSGTTSSVSDPFSTALSPTSSRRPTGVAPSVSSSAVASFPRSSPTSFPGVPPTSTAMGGAGAPLRPPRSLFVEDDEVAVAALRRCFILSTQWQWLVQGGTRDEDLQDATARVAQLRRQAMVARLSDHWRAVTERRVQQRLGWISSHTLVWRERAKAKVQERRDEQATQTFMREMLLDQRRQGIRLSIPQQNFLHMPDAVEGATYDCPVCYSSSSLDEVYVGVCRHIMCISCMVAHVKDAIGSGHATEIACPSAECSRVLGPDEVEMLLAGDSREISRYHQFLLNQSLESDPNLVRCPKPTCQFVMIKEVDNPMVRCGNPACNFTYCSECKVEWHADATCAQYQTWKRENAASDDLFAAWRERNTKPCPTCRRAIQKDGGCNHMTCRKPAGCGGQFCWLCGGAYTSSHFSEGPCKGKQFT